MNRGYLFFKDSDNNKYDYGYLDGSKISDIFLGYTLKIEVIDGKINVSCDNYGNPLLISNLSSHIEVMSFSEGSVYNIIDGFLSDENRDLFLCFKNSNWNSVLNFLDKSTSIRVESVPLVMSKKIDQLVVADDIIGFFDLSEKDDSFKIELFNVKVDVSDYMEQLGIQKITDCEFIYSGELTWSNLISELNKIGLENFGKFTNNDING